MTLRSEYTLGHSPYNAFLFALVGEEKVGVPLTVFSALTRLGFDPWGEAARLAALPKETAARAFAVTIAMLPEGNWNATDVEAIAARLVGWLPDGRVPSIPEMDGVRTDTKRTEGSRTMSIGMMLAWGVLAVALVYFTVNLATDNNLEQSWKPIVSTLQ
ncbi:MAG: hypothetical protein IKE60_08030 [Reyranella sp.]|uniref:hypothetical protein n=1 Tax=Reyranella sp. TaxID=1929291 RepID=UPI001AD0F51A|nr:hypothetical protein [Reyranella sp.]MBN9537308.1 hypothetical protein [Alphaproteobacteria bacterium]MBR2814586.1 hypothetical protein [Reyranella sp.]